MILADSRRTSKYSSVYLGDYKLGNLLDMSYSIEREPIFEIGHSGPLVAGNSGETLLRIEMNYVDCQVLAATAKLHKTLELTIKEGRENKVMISGDLEIIPEFQQVFSRVKNPKSKIELELYLKDSKFYFGDIKCEISN